MLRHGWRPAVLVGLAALALVVLPGSGHAQNQAFVIGTDDVIEVQVWDNKDLNQTVFVRPDGKVSLPLVGEIQAAGKTVQRLQDDLVEIYSRTVRQPVVTVFVRTINSRPVYFIGGFGKTGPIQLTRDLTLLQAAAVVGGVIPTADAEKGFVLRGERKIPVDFDRLLKRGDLSQNLSLQPGDSVVVPLAEVVHLQGEVRTPGPLKHTSDLTIVRAITQAGGLAPLAAANRVDVLRGEGEKRVRIRVDVDKMLREPEDHPDMLLKPNDIVFVPQRLF